MSNQSGGPSGPGRFFASIYEAINNCNLEQLDAIIVAMFFFVGGGLLIGAIFLANLVGYFTPIAKTAVQMPQVQQHAQFGHTAAAHPAYVQQHPAPEYHAPAHVPGVAHQQAYPGFAQTYPVHTYPAQHYVAPAQTYPAPVVGNSWSTTPQNFGRPRSASHGWYPFADARFGQAEASNQPPM